MSKKIIACFLSLTWAPIASANTFLVVELDESPAILTGDKVHSLSGDSAEILKIFDDRVALVRINSHGSMCFNKLRWFSIEGSSSDEFTTCLDVKNISVENGDYLVHGIDRGSYVESTYRWRPGFANVIEAERKLSVGDSIPADSTSNLIGKHVSDLILAPEWQEHLTKQFGDISLSDLLEAFSGPSTPFFDAGGWIVSSGCKAHNCGNHNAVIAVNEENFDFAFAMVNVGPVNSSLITVGPIEHKSLPSEFSNEIEAMRDKLSTSSIATLGCDELADPSLFYETSKLRKAGAKIEDIDRIILLSAGESSFEKRYADILATQARIVWKNGESSIPEAVERVKESCWSIFMEN